MKAGNRMFRWHVFLSAFLWMCGCFSAGAQNPYVDSLKGVLKSGDLSDRDRMDILTELGNNSSYSDAVQSARYFREVYRIASRRDDPFNMGRAMSGIGNTWYHRGNYDSAVYYFDRAGRLYAGDTSQESRESVATNKANIANVEQARHHYEKALWYFLDAIDVMEKSHDNNKWKALGNLYASVGTVYHDMQQDDKALVYDLKGLEAHREQKDNRLLTAYLELYVAGDYIDLKEMDKAASHLAAGEKLALQVRSDGLFNQLYSGWGNYYRRSGVPEKAAGAYRKALRYAEKIGSKFHRMDGLRMLGFIYRDLKAYGESVRYLGSALPLSRELGNKRLEADILKNLAFAEAARRHNDQAVRYYRRYTELSDSLNEAETKRKINEIENRYQAEKKQVQIAALEENNRLQQSELRQKNLLNILLVLGCALLLLVAVLFYVNFKNKHRILMQKETLHMQRIRELEKERQLVAAQSVMKGQEEERSRLSRDLHDGVGGLLSGVKLSLSTMKGNVFLSEGNAQSFNNVILQLDRSIAELRRVSHNMMPEALIKFGLREALENYCEHLNLAGKIKVQLQVYGLERRPEQSEEIVLYRMVQELLNNVIRHAGAGHVLIQLVREEHRFTLTVEDDGKGFDVREAEKKGGAGLANIRARAAYLGGTVDIRAVPGEGTSVYIEGRIESV